jgi:hypothetical protein
LRAACGGLRGSERLCDGEDVLVAARYDLALLVLRKLAIILDNNFVQPERKWKLSSAGVATSGVRLCGHGGSAAGRVLRRRGGGIGAARRCCAIAGYCSTLRGRPRRCRGGALAFSVGGGCAAASNSFTLER